tara:strand:+ start:3387 stop:3737 length:351 start_codon:yes stop_codon:yes gene_type:complete
MKIEYTSEWFEDNADSIGDWFDPETFEWSRYSVALAVHCSKYIKIWFDPDKYNWRLSSDYLAMYCSSDFEFWFNPDNYNFNYRNELFNCCLEYIYIWYDSSKFKESYDELLLLSIK